MKREFIVSLIVGLCVTTALPTFAQQRASSRRQQPRANASAATAEKSDVANTAKPSASSESATATATPARNAAPSNRPNGEQPRAPRMGRFALMALQMQARQSSLDSDGKVKIDSFISAFMKAAKEADADGDGILSEEELGKIRGSMEGMNPFNAPGMRPQGRRGVEQGNGAPRGRRAPNDQTNTFDVSSSILRAQEAENGPQGRRGGAGFPGGRGGFPGGAGMGATPGFMEALNGASNEETGAVDLSKLETGLKKAMTAADADSDGALSDEEWRTFAGGGFGMGGRGFEGMGAMGARMRTGSVAMLQGQIATASQEAGKINIEKFRSEYAKALKEADSNSDGVIDSEELQALQTKVAESMATNRPQRGPNGMNGGFGGRGGNPFEGMRNEDGKIDLSKLPDNPFMANLKEFDKDGDGLLDEDEQQALQEQMRQMFQNRGQGMRPGDGGNGRPEDRPDRRRNGNDDSFGSIERSGVIIRAQEGENQNGGPGFGGPGMGGPGFGGPGFGGPGFGGPGFGGPGFGGPGMGGPGMGRGFGGFGMGGFGGGSNVVQSAITKATSEDGKLDIAAFDAELGKLLSDADNEDDGLLDSLEQEDAFGRAIVRPEGERPEGRPEGQGRRPDGERPSGQRVGERPSRNDRENPRENGRESTRGGRDGANDVRMQAFRVPTPDSSFVGVVADPDFKFAKGRDENSAAEKSPIEADYAIGKYEVRNREFKEFVDATKRKELPKYWTDGTYPKGTKNCPVVGVTLKDAQDYCEWLSSKYEGWSFRLPTEAEFENAAAGPKKLRYPWGTTSGFTFTKGNLEANCQYNATVVAELGDAVMTVGGKKVKVADSVTISAKGVLSKGWRDSAEKTGFTYSDLFTTQSKAGGFVVPVYKFRENSSPFGCIGMAGNAAEWTSSVVGGKNVVRGGSWYSSADECSSTYRGDVKDPSKGDPTIGFRVVAERVE